MNSTRGASDSPGTRDPQLRRAAWAGLIGTVLEQYDFVIYGTAAAIVFSQLFFPNVSPAVGLLASFSTYAVGFLARPLGGVFFARYGDRLGRKWVLVATLTLMGVATMAIGLLPTYEQVGVLAPILLVLCRIAQGFGTGAEQSGGATFLTESAPPGQRGRYAALVMSGAAIGTALGAVTWTLVQWLPEDQFMSWGWRAVFLSSIFVTLAAYIIRRRVQESEVFTEVKKNVAPRAPLADVLRDGKKPMFLALFITVGASVYTYAFQVFAVSYLVTDVGVERSFVLQALFIASLIAAVTAVVFGALSDKFGRRKVYLVLVVTALILTIPLFLMMATGSPALVLLALVLAVAVMSLGLVGPTMSYLPELFGSRYRYAGLTLGRELAAVLGGGIAPLICSALLTYFSGSWWPVAGYLMFMMTLTLVATILAPETKDRDLTATTNATDPHDVGAVGVERIQVRDDDPQGVR